MCCEYSTLHHVDMSLAFLSTRHVTAALPFNDLLAEICIAANQVDHCSVSGEGISQNGNTMASQHGFAIALQGVKTHFHDEAPCTDGMVPAYMYCVVDNAECNATLHYMLLGSPHEISKGP